MQTWNPKNMLLIRRLWIVLGRKKYYVLWPLHLSFELRAFIFNSFRWYFTSSHCKLDSHNLNLISVSFELFWSVFMHNKLLLIAWCNFSFCELSCKLRPFLYLHYYMLSFYFKSFALPKGFWNVATLYCDVGWRCCAIRQSIQFIYRPHMQSARNEQNDRNSVGMAINKKSKVIHFAY